MTSVHNDEKLWPETEMECENGCESYQQNKLSVLHAQITVE